MTLSPLPDDALARIKELLANRRRLVLGKRTLFDLEQTNISLITLLGNNVEALISRLEAAEERAERAEAAAFNEMLLTRSLMAKIEAAEARAAAGEAACVDARRALGLALLADGLCDEIKARLKIAWLRVGGANASAALTANPKDMEGQQGNIEQQNVGDKSGKD